MKSLFIYLFLLSYQHSAYLNRIDSLKAVLPDTKDVQYTKILTSIAENYLQINLDSSKVYSQAAYNIASRIGNKDLQANALSNLGEAFVLQGINDSAYFYYRQAHDLFKETSNKSGIAKTLDKMALVFRYWGNYRLSMEYLVEALKIFDDLQDKRGAASAHNNLGVIYRNYNNPEQALWHFRKALELATETSFYEEIANSNTKIGNIYWYSGNNQEALFYYERALKIAVDYGIRSEESGALNNIGNVFRQSGNFSKALEYYGKSLAISKQIQDQNMLSVTEKNIGLVYKNSELFNKAIEHFEISLDYAQKANLKKLIFENYMYLSDVYSSLGNTAKAFELYKSYVSFKDSLFNEETAQRINMLKMKYDKDSEIQQIELDSQKQLTQLYLVILFLSLVSVAVSVILGIKLKRRYSDLKERNEQLVSSNSFMKSMMESIPNAVFYTDINMNILGCNKDFEMLTLKQPTEIIGYNVREILSPFFDEVTFDKSFSISDSSYSLWLSTKMAKGTTKETDIILHKAPFTDKNGVLNGFIFVLVDITELIKSETALSESQLRYQTLVENAYDAIYLLNGQSFEYVNPKFTELTGYSTNEIYSSKFKFHDLFDESSSDIFYNEYNKLLHGEPLARQLELVIVSKLGERINVETSVVSLGEPAQAKILGVMRDITERKRIQSAMEEYQTVLENSVAERTAQLENALEELKIANADAAQALIREKELNELKTRFISMISHEYRTPLTVILSSTYLLEQYFDSNLKDGHSRTLSRIQESIKSMTHLLNEVITLGRYESDNVDVNLKKINIVELISSIISEQKLIDNNKHIIIFSPYNDTIEFRTDQMAFYQIFSNLLSNALKYSPEGTIVEMLVTEYENGIEIQVCDKGIGIPESDFIHLFEPFFRAHNVGAVSGSGLGLSILKKSIESLRGDIRFNSKPGEGTTFSVKLPYLNSNNI